MSRIVHGGLFDWSRFCLCGAAYAGSGLTAAQVRAWEDFWRAEHSGEGHGEATAEQAARARRVVE